MILSFALRLLWHTAPGTSLCPVCVSAKTPKRNQDQLRFTREPKTHCFLILFREGQSIYTSWRAQQWKVSGFFSLNESAWVLLHPNHFFTAFCGQRAAFGCVATSVLGYKSHSVAGRNTLTLTVMLCSSHSFHPSFPNTNLSSLRRSVYSRILPFHRSETDLHGYGRQLTFIISTIIFLIS